MWRESWWWRALLETKEKQILLLFGYDGIKENVETQKKEKNYKPTFLDLKISTKQDKNHPFLDDTSCYQTYIKGEKTGFITSANQV